MYDIFISYSRKDSDIVLKYVDFLEQQGFKVWIDRNGIYSGEAFKSVITKAIIESNIFLFFSSASSNTSPWVEKEIGVAVYKNKHIIPIKIDNSEYSNEVLLDLVNLDFIVHKNDMTMGCNMLVRSIMRYNQNSAPQVILLGTPESGKTSLAMYLSRISPQTGMKVVGDYNLTMNYEINNTTTTINGQTYNLWKKRIPLWNNKNIDLYDICFETNRDELLSAIKPSCAIVLTAYKLNYDTWEQEIDYDYLEETIKLAKVYGIKTIIPFINKLDMNDEDVSIKQSETFFNTVLSKYGFKQWNGGMSGSVLGALNGVPEWEERLEPIITELGNIK